MHTLLYIVRKLFGVFDFHGTHNCHYTSKYLKVCYGENAELKAKDAELSAKNSQLENELISVKSLASAQQSQIEDLQLRLEVLEKVK